MKITAIVFFMLLTGSFALWAQVVGIESAQSSLDTTLNTRYFEQNPSLAGGGNGIYFTRSGNEENLGGVLDEGDIFYAEIQEDGTWGVAQNIGTPVNTMNKNTLIGVADNGNTLVLTYQYNADKGQDKGFAISRKQGTSWTVPRNIDIPYFKCQSEFKSASISPAGDVIVFSIMTFGTFGVEDLYFTRQRDNGTWTDLRNLGSVVNTRFQELTPFIAPDNETLYFASNGHQGEGSLDIFWSRRLDDTWRNWTKPVNLGSMVNSSGAETSFSFLPGSKYAVLVSTQNSDGYGDLKKVMISFPDDFDALADTISHANRIKVPEAEDLATAITQKPIGNTNEFSGKLLDARSQVIISGTLTFLSEFDTLHISSNDTGGFKTTLREANYNLIVKAPGYLEYDTAFSIGPTDRGLRKDFELEPLEVGNTITLKHVLFERGTTRLIAGSEQDLEAVYNMLTENPSLEIEVGGHTDNQGNFKLNVQLSEERVGVVIAYLIEKGIKKRRLSGKGWGPMKPIAPNNSEESRRLNRRVEFTILKN